MVSTRRSNHIAALSSQSLSLSGQPSPSNQNAPPKTIKTNGPGAVEQKSSDRETMGALGQGTAHSQQNASFLLFPKLPLELQRLIWSFASSIIPQASPRIFRIAPDQKCWSHLEGFRMLDRAMDGSQLLITPDQPLSPPSLLLACQESRTAAYRDYVRWGATYPRNSVPSGKVVYLNKVYDTVYFAERPFGDFWFFELLLHCGGPGQKAYRYAREALALREYVDQLSGIQNIAIPCRKFIDLFLTADHTWPWLQSLHSLKELTIILGLPTKERGGKPVRFSSIKPGTVRAASAEKLSWWSGKCLEAFQSKVPYHTLPRVLLATTSDEKSSSNNAEVSQKGYIDWLYEHTARQHFGPFVPDT